VQGTIRKDSEIIGNVEAEESAVPFFVEFSKFDLLMACNALLAEMKEAVAQAHKRFG
jgi:hypothetical protein